MVFVRNFMLATLVRDNSMPPFQVIRITANMKVDLTGTFVLQYVYQNLELPPFILAAQAQLFAVITKLGWNENQEFRPLLDHFQVFFQVRDTTV